MLCPQSRVLSVPLLRSSSLTGPLDVLCASAFLVNSLSLMTVSSPPPQPPVPPAPAPPLDNEQPADWFSHGPLSRFPSLYGWGRGDPTPPGSGTQSWLFCPLISLGLALAQSRMGVPPYSTGNREQVLTEHSGQPTHIPSSVHTPITSTLWTVTNLQLHSCSHGKADTWTLSHRRLSPLPTSSP